MKKKNQRKTMMKLVNGSTIATGPVKAKVRGWSAPPIQPDAKVTMTGTGDEFMRLLASKGVAMRELERAYSAACEYLVAIKRVIDSMGYTGFDTDRLKFYEKEFRNAQFLYQEATHGN